MSTACATDDQGRIMSSLNTKVTEYNRLGQAFCIPQFKVNEIGVNNGKKQWDCLNGVVGEWLKWNFTEDVKGKVKPNADWLIRAVEKIDSELAQKLRKGNKLHRILGQSI